MEDPLDAEDIEAEAALVRRGGVHGADRADPD